MWASELSSGTRVVLWHWQLGHVLVNIGALLARWVHPMFIIECEFSSLAKRLSYPKWKDHYALSRLIVLQLGPIFNELVHWIEPSCLGMLGFKVADPWSNTYSQIFLSEWLLKFLVLQNGLALEIPTYAWWEDFLVSVFQDLKFFEFNFLREILSVELSEPIIFETVGIFE